MVVQAAASVVKDSGLPPRDPKSKSPFSTHDFGRAKAWCGYVWNLAAEEGTIVLGGGSMAAECFSGDQSFTEGSLTRVRGEAEAGR